MSKRGVIKPGKSGVNHANHDPPSGKAERMQLRNPDSAVLPETGSVPLLNRVRKPGCHARLRGVDVGQLVPVRTYRADSAYLGQRAKALNLCRCCVHTYRIQPAGDGAHAADARRDPFDIRGIHSQNLFRARTASGRSCSRAVRNWRRRTVEHSARFTMVGEKNPHGNGRIFFCRG